MTADEPTRALEAVAAQDTPAGRMARRLLDAAERRSKHTDTGLQPAPGAQLLRVAADRIGRAGTPSKKTPFTRERREAFLDALACGLTVTAAADLVGIKRTHVYHVIRTDERFAQAFHEARDLSVDFLEERLSDIALTGDPSSMATVRAAETVMRGRSARYQTGGRASVQLKQGEGGSSLSVSVGTPLPG